MRSFTRIVLFALSLLMLMNWGCEESTTSERTVVTIADIWWTDAVDNDDDQYYSALKLNFDLNVNKEKDISVYVVLRVSISGQTTSEVYFQSTAFNINGTSTDDAKFIQIGLDNGYVDLYEGVYDFELLVFPGDGSTESVASANAANNTNLAGVGIEMDSEDTAQQLSVWSVYQVDGIDNDSDGYYSSISLEMDIDVSEGFMDVYVVAYYKLSTATTYNYFDESNVFTLDGFSSSDAIELAISEMPYGDYDFMFEIYRAGTTTPSLSVDKFDFSDLGDIPLEPSSEDVGGFTITFNNPVFTEIDVQVSGYELKTIPVGGSVTYNLTANPGSFTYHAETSGHTNTGTQIGLFLTWDYTHNVSGQTSVSYNLNVSESYFFIYVTNNGTDGLTPFYVNYGNSTYQSQDNILLPNDGVKYRTGYYYAFSNTEVRAYFQNTPSSYVYWNNLGLPFTVNQYANLSNSFEKASFTDESRKGDTKVELNSGNLLPAIERPINYKYDKNAISDLAK